MEFTIQTLHKHIIKIHIKQHLSFCFSKKMIIPEVLLPTQRYQAIIALPNMFNWLKFMANEMPPGCCSANERAASGHNGGAGEQRREEIPVYC